MRFPRIDRPAQVANHGGNPAGKVARLVEELSTIVRITRFKFNELGHLVCCEQGLATNLLIRLGE